MPSAHSIHTAFKDSHPVPLPARQSLEKGREELTPAGSLSYITGEERKKTAD